MEQIRIAVLGVPNSGKTTLINSITGSGLRATNFAGGTVGIDEVNIKRSDVLLTFFDTPGLYSLDDNSSEEISITNNFINKTENYDVILCVVDVRNLERDISFAIKLVNSTNKNFLLAVNSCDILDKCHTEIDVEKMSEILGVKCLKISAKYKINLDKVIEVILQKNYPKRVKNIAISSHSILNQVLTKKKSISRVIGYFLDNILINKFIGIPIFLGIMFINFKLTFAVGDLIGGQIDYYFNLLKDLFDSTFHPNSWIYGLISEGILPGVLSIIRFVPNIIIMLFVIDFIEQSGYMTRIAYLLDDFLRNFGINGRCIIPLITGFGCSIPAYSATRIIEDKKIRIAVMFGIGLIPCSAKIIVFSFIVNNIATTYKGLILFFIYFVSIFLALLIIKLTNVALDGKLRKVLILEIPPYQLPSFKRIIRNSFLRGRDFIKNIGTTIIVISFIIWCLTHIPSNYKNFTNYFEIFGNYYASLSDDLISDSSRTETLRYLHENSIIGAIGKSAAVIFSPLGFDWKMNIALFNALAAKEVAVSVLGILYYDPANLSGNLLHQISIPSILSFLTFIIIYVPCVSAMATFQKELGEKKYLYILIGVTTIAAWVFSFIVFNLSKFFLL